MNKPKCRHIYSPVQIAECGGPCEQGPEHCDCGELWITAPEPPSLKELALQALYRFDDTEGHEGLTPEQIADDFVLIRRALESLPS